jgi:hypothetical protein
MKERYRCIIFLEQNGWKCEIDTPIEAHACYYKNGYVGVDIGADEMVFISDTGDFLHVPINYYSLIGILMEYRQIDCNYVSINRGTISHNK